MFGCHLTRPTSPPPVLDDNAFQDAGVHYESLVMLACEQLHETDCRFHMSGFGDPDWRVDVWYDLSVVVEQLPDLLDGIRARRRAEVDIYSQGVERMLTFRPVGAGWEIRCLSRTDWVPEPAVEIVGTTRLAGMFSRLAADFAGSLDVIGSPVARVAPFAGWLSRA
jgi:hypothetical protein